MSQKSTESWLSKLTISWLKVDSKTTFQINSTYSWLFIVDFTPTGKSRPTVNKQSSVLYGYLDGRVWIDICDGSLFCRWYQERRRISYRFRPLCVKRMWHRSYCERFSDGTNYQMASVVIEYRKRVLIILVSIRLHRIWYFDLSSYNTICLTYRVIEECIGKFL